MMVGRVDRLGAVDRIDHELGQSADLNYITHTRSLRIVPEKSTWAALPACLTQIKDEGRELALPEQVENSTRLTTPLKFKRFRCY